MALCEDDIDEAYIQSAGAVLVSGTHFSTPTVEAASHKAIRAAKAAGRKVVFDVDYRPNLWGLAGHDAGDNRYIRSEAVTRRLDAVVSQVDLIVGTEEELMIAGGGETMLDSVRRIRALTPPPSCSSRGRWAASSIPQAIPERLEDGIRGPGFPVDVYNTLGAGDGFMAGFLRGWLKGEPIETTCAWANACGAIAVSRLLCSPEYPTFDELQAFIARKPTPRVLRHDVALNNVHWVETRRPQPDSLMALAIDHRSQLEAIADRLGAPRERIGNFKELAVAATARVADGRPGFGMLLDGTYGMKALYAAAGHPFWIGRPVEQPGSRPLDFEGGGDLGAHLTEWPVIQTVKCLCFYHPDDPDDLKARQERELLRVFDAARTVGRELMIEIIAGKNGPLVDDTVAQRPRPPLPTRHPARLVEAGAAGKRRRLGDYRPHHRHPRRRVAAASSCSASRRRRPIWCAALRLPRGTERVKGFAVGRTIFGEAAAAWLAGRIDDEAAIDDMATRFAASGRRLAQRGRRRRAPPE